MLFASMIVALTAPPTVAGDAPPGADIVLRLELASLSQPLADAWPRITALLPADRDAFELWQVARAKAERLAAQLADASGASLDRKGANLTLCIDVDAPGGAVLSAVLRGVGGDRRPSTEPEQVIDGNPVWRLAEEGWLWARVGGALVIGDERGVQRQMRQVGGAPPENDEPLARAARSLSQPAPLLAAVVLPPRVRQSVAAQLSDYGEIVGRVDSLTLRARGKLAELHLGSHSADDQKIVELGVRSALALLRAGIAAAEGGGELLAALHAAKRPSQLLPKKLDVAAVTPLVETSVRGFSMKSAVRVRTKTRTEVLLEPSSWEALAAVAFLAAGKLELGSAPEPVDLESEVQQVLVGVREAQLLYRETNGEFLACPPTPRQVPQGAVPWRNGHCFEKVGFVPRRPLRLQLEAVVQQGRLLLIGRADPDGDGVPRVWYLDGDSAEMRGPEPTDPAQ